jgi:plastocyanin
MFRISRVLTARHTAVLGALALACSDGSGPDGGATTGAIVGTVSSSGTGVSGAGIALTGTGTGNTTTSATGTYSFNSLAPGNYTVTVALPTGFSLATGETAAKQATVAAGATATVNWSATGGDDVTTVTLSGTSFTPGNVTIGVGETVRWVVSNGSHTVTPDNPGQPGVWTGTGLLNSGDQFQHTFTTAGTFDYHCIPHQSLGMTGTITVQ